jgi:predicted phage terminase large subunit-like protein
MTRRMGPKLVIITMTRWSPDDLVGRLTDPENEHYNAELARMIKIINLPAIAGDDDPLGREPGQPLWPERFDLDFLHQQRLLDPLGFEALYQQRPSLADGDMFRRESIQLYDPGAPPFDVNELRVFCASDHAVATGQRSDYTVLLRCGVDRQHNIYVLDCWWQKKPTDVVVEAMIQMLGATPRPLIWWAEKGHISKSIGPFLRKRMSETGIYGNIVEVTPSADKAQRAQSISARTAMGKLYLPKGKPWTEKAINELLAFPNGLHDDFVDALAYIGLGLQSQFPVKRVESQERPAGYGTLGWLKEQQRKQAQGETLRFGGF